MARKSKRKSIEDYIRLAKKNTKLVPSLAKYKNRKRLSRGQKAWITRVSNEIYHAGGTKHLYPLTKKQAKSLKAKDLIYGHGIRAIRLEEVTPDQKISVKKGEFIIKQNGRIWHSIQIPIGPEGEEDGPFIRKVKPIFDRLPKNHQIHMSILTTQGKVPGARGTFAEILQLFHELLESYGKLPGHTMRDWFVGVIYWIQKSRGKTLKEYIDENKG